MIAMSVGIHSDILSRPIPVRSFASHERPDLITGPSGRSIKGSHGTRGKGAGLLAQLVMVLIMALGGKRAARKHG